jgi:hypothetical protein
MSKPGTFEQLAEAVGLAFVNLSDEFTPKHLSTFLLELGLEEITDLSGDSAFTQKASAAVAALTSLATQLGKLEQAFADDDLPSALAAVAAVGQSIAASRGAFDAVASDLQRAAQAAGGASSAASLSAVLVDRIVEYAVVGQLERSAPVTLCLLELFTVVERNAVTLGSGANAVTVLRRRIFADRLARLIRDPLSLLQAGYGWGTGTLELPLLLQRLGRLLLAADILVGDELDQNGNPAQGPGLDLFFLTLGPTGDSTPPGLSIKLAAGTASSSTIPLYQPTPGWQLSLDLDGAVADDLVLELLPPARLVPVAVAAPNGATLRLAGQASDPADPFVLLAIAGGSQLLANTVELTLAWLVEANNPAASELTFGAKVAGAAVLSSQGGDGFLAEVLPGQFTAGLDFALTWSAQRGFAFSGAASLDATLPAGLSVGPVSIQSIHLGLYDDSGGLSFECSATAGLSLGPVQVLVDRIGLLAGLTFPAGGGNLGVAEGTLGFKQPSGLGLSIDAGIVTGGGFLGFDPTNSEYRGAAQLSMEGVGLAAFGLVQTQPKVSFLLLIGTTFPVPIELGFGFALAGVGGIVGINRTVALDALETAVWKGTAKNLLFPSAPITNAATILGTLDTLFPAAPGRYLFGPTGQITWGEPAIVTANIGLVMELPEPIRIALFGNVVAQFPLKNPIVVLQVTFAGGIDFGSERLFFDASLSGSRIERYPISGDLSLRSSLTSPKNLALAVGGFNPHFQPPAGFPTLSRLALDISDGPLHLHLAAYLAITTNTFQIGAAIDLKAHVCDCDLAGHFAFDALFVKNPFSFEIDIDASASIAFEGDTFAGIHVSGSLAGPAPWHAKGSASISLLFFSIGVDFDHSWGSPPPPTLPPVDPWTTALAPALADPTSWKWVLPPGVHPVVSLAPAAGSGPTLLDPAGEIILDQKAVPLNQSIDCFADTVLATPLRFDLAALAVNSAGLDAADWITITDEFAPAQFTTMTDDEKLSAESFVALVSGMAIGGTAASVGTSVSASLTYDQIILDSTRKAGPRLPYPLPLALQIASAASGPSARAPWRTSGLGRFAAAPAIPSKAALAPAAFAIVSTATLGVAQPAVANTRYTAALALKDYVAQHSVAPQSVQAVQARAA